MASPLKEITICGFKSIEQVDKFDLRPLNVLIGANGAGKSNFVDFFSLLRSMADEGLARFVEQAGGADRLLFLGPAKTSQITARLTFGQNLYGFTLEPTPDNRLIVANEWVQYTGGMGWGTPTQIASGTRESQLKGRKGEPATVGSGRGVESWVYRSVSSWTVYHFHDTSPFAPMRRPHAQGYRS